MTISQIEPSLCSHESRRGLAPLFIGLVLAMFLASLSQTVLSAAMPTMVGELGGVDQMLWVMTAFMLASTITMPIYGKMSDLIGRKGPMIFAIVTFMIGSVVGALAPDMGVLIAGRVVQGLGGGGLIILSHATIADVVPARERGKYLAVLNGVFAVSSVAGPLLGGWLTEAVSWRWTFWLNVPLGALTLVAVITLLHLPKGVSSKPTIDVFGIATLAAATVCLILVASWAGNDYEWTSPVILSLIAATVVLAVLFVVIEHRATAPIIPVTLFRDRNFNLTTAASVVVGVTFFGTMGYLPTYLQMTFGADATSAGILMLPMIAMMLVASLLSGWLVSKYGRYKWMPIAGSALMGIALVLLGTMTPETPLWRFCVDIGLLGLGLGVNFQILLLIVQNTFPNRIVGTATAANSFFRQIGASLGSAVIGSLFTLRLIDSIGERLPSETRAQVGDISSLTPHSVKDLPGHLRDIVVHSYSDALTPLMLWMAPLALIALVLLCFVEEVPLRTIIGHDSVPNAFSDGQLVSETEGTGSNEMNPYSLTDKTHIGEKMRRIEFSQPGELRDRIIASVLSGAKTATSRLAAFFDVEEKPISRPGDRYEVIDSDGGVAGVIEIDEVRIMRFAAVGEDVSNAEGGFFESVENWRSVHVRGWRSYAAAMEDALKDPDLVITDDSPVVVRFFHLVE